MSSVLSFKRKQKKLINYGNIHYSTYFYMSIISAQANDKY